MNEKNVYYVYMLRCIDDSIYTGITTDVNRRMKEHFSKEEKCAKYTLRHTPKKLEMVWETENRTFASKLEYYIKTLTKMQKEELIRDNKKLKEFFFDKIECNKYKSKKRSIHTYEKGKLL